MGTGVGVHIHRSERTDTLLADLAEVLRHVSDDPFAVDVVAVPTPGIERFLSQGLGRVLGSRDGRSDGVCANVAFPSPASIVNRVIARATGVPPETDPWLAHRAVWPLLAVIDRSADEDWCAALARHLGRPGSVDRPEQSQEPHGSGHPGWDRAGRRFAVASRLSELFASYASQRPGLLLDWHDGRDTDGAGGPLPSDLAWQPELWRRLRAEIGSPSPAERLEAACAAVAADRDIVDLPGRISVFGPSRLPADHLRVMAALGTGREVHLWLSDASPAALGVALGRICAAPSTPGGPVRRCGAPPPAPVPRPRLPGAASAPGRIRRTGRVIGRALPRRTPRRPPSWATCRGRSAAMSTLGPSARHTARSRCRPATDPSRCTPVTGSPARRKWSAR